MHPVTAMTAALGWLGRQGTRAVPISIFLGMALPPLASVLRPYFTATIFVLLTLAFLRVEPVALRAVAMRPALALAATAWIVLATPALMGGLVLATGLAAYAPAIVIALVLQSAAPPLTATPAFAALLGLDTALTLGIMLLSLALTPLVAPVIVQAVLGESLSIAPLALSLRLFAIVAGAAVAATLVRAIAGSPRVARAADIIDGLNVVALFVFAIALMDGVAARTVAEPGLVLGLVALTFVTATGLGAVTWLVFRAAGRTEALTVALSGGERNLSLMLAATAGAAPDHAWLYVALAQFPIYLSPLLLKPLADRVTRRDRLTPSPPSSTPSA